VTDSLVKGRLVPLVGGLRGERGVSLGQGGPRPKEVLCIMYVRVPTGSDPPGEGTTFRKVLQSCTPNLSPEGPGERPEESIRLAGPPVGRKGAPTTNGDNPGGLPLKKRVTEKKTSWSTSRL